MAGGALAFDLLQELIIYLAVENRQLEAALSTRSKAAAAAKQALEQALASAPVSAPPARESMGRVVAAVAAAVAAAPTPAAKAVDCGAIPSDNITALMDCIHKFNR
jgi:hypothetical protein